MPQARSPAQLWPHLLRGLADAVTHGLHVALLLLQLLLQLCDAGLQAALLVLQRVPRDMQPCLGLLASRPGNSLSWEEQALELPSLITEETRLRLVQSHTAGKWGARTSTQLVQQNQACEKDQPSSRP